MARRPLPDKPARSTSSTPSIDRRQRHVYQYAGTVSGAAGGFVDFHEEALPPPTRHFINYGGAVSGAGWREYTYFSDNTTAANAMVTANGGDRAAAPAARRSASSAIPTRPRRRSSPTEEPMAAPAD